MDPLEFVDQGSNGFLGELALSITAFTTTFTPPGQPAPDPAGTGVGGGGGEGGGSEVPVPVSDWCSKELILSL
jgi:hypothetical protein